VGEYSHLSHRAKYKKYDHGVRCIRDEQTRTQVKPITLFYHTFLCYQQVIFNTFLFRWKNIKYKLFFPSTSPKYFKIINIIVLNSTISSIVPIDTLLADLNTILTPKVVVLLSSSNKIENERIPDTETIKSDLKKRSVRKRQKTKNCCFSHKGSNWSKRTYFLQPLNTPTDWNMRFLICWKKVELRRLNCHFFIKGKKWISKMDS